MPSTESDYRPWQLLAQFLLCAIPVLGILQLMRTMGWGDAPGPWFFAAFACSVIVLSVNSIWDQRHGRQKITVSRILKASTVFGLAAFLGKWLWEFAHD